MHVDNWNPDTFKPILEDLDLPYIESEWNALLAKCANNPERLAGVLGKYIGKMRLNQWADKRYSDSDALNTQTNKDRRDGLKMQGLSDDEIEIQMAVDHRPERPKFLDSPAVAATEASSFDIDEIEKEDEELADQLTAEEKTALKIKWGRSYRLYELLRLEQLYNDMEHSYDIQGAGHRDTLLLLCKASLKANQLIDAGDLAGFKQVSSVYDQLMKSGKFTAAQVKKEEEGDLDSVGELVALCEKEGFIPRYYISQPNDYVDKVLKDMQSYTHTLVTEEVNLGNMLELAMKDIEADRAKEQILDTDDENALNELLFAEEEKVETAADFEEFQEFEEEQRKEDEKNGIS